MLSIASLRVAGSALLISRVANNTNTGKRVGQFPIVTVLTAHRRMRYAVERALTGPPNPGRTVGAGDWLSGRAPRSHRGDLSASPAAWQAVFEKVHNEALARALVR